MYKTCATKDQRRSTMQWFIGEMIE